MWQGGASSTVARERTSNDRPLALASTMTDLSAAVFLNAGRTQLYTVRMFRVMVTGTPSEGAAFAGFLIVIILIALAVLARLTGKSFVDLFRVS